MARRRDGKVKGDVVTDLLKKVQVAHLLPERMHGLFYQLLENFGFAKMDSASQGTAIIAGWTFCKMMMHMDTRKRPDDPDPNLDDLCRLQKQWCSLLEAMRKQAGEERELPEDVGQSIQEELMASLSGSDSD